MRDWGYSPSEDQFQTVLFRARAAVATNYGRHYLTFEEFRANLRRRDARRIRKPQVHSMSETRAPSNIRGNHE
jgi:hypothetical protein